MGQLTQQTSSEDSSFSCAKLPFKRCPSCNIRLPLHAFYTAGRSKTGQTRLHSHCKRCKLQRETERRAVRSARSELESSSSASLSSSLPSQLPPSRGHLNRVPEHESGVKLCTSCQSTKPLDKFYTAGRHKGGSVRFHSHCKSCKLENEAAQRMQPRKGSQEVEMSEPMAGLPLHLQAEQQSGPSTPNTLLQQLQASRLPQPPMMGPMPGLLNPQQLQALMVFRQNPALFSNPVLQSQLAMLMWTQMQQQQAPMWPIHQPPPMLQPLTGQQPLSAAAQSASTHQPSCQGPAPLHSGSGRLSDECNSSGGSNDSGCIQTISGATPKVEQSPPADAQLAAQRFADDSDSAVTWAGRGADQTACTQSRSASHPEASGTQFCLHNSGQLSGRDVTSSHLPEPLQWPAAETPVVPAPAGSPFAAGRIRGPGHRTSGQHSTATAIQLARAASNAAKQSLAATAAITDQALPRKGSSSLLADLRQAERKWMQVAQAQPSPAATPPAKVAELKRSSRQAARAVDQSQLASDAQELLPSAPQADATFMIHSGLPPLRWGKQMRVHRVRGHRQVGRPNDRFSGWTVSGGILKPVASRQASVAARALPAEGRAFRVEPSLFKSIPAQNPKAAAPEPLLLAAAVAKAPEEIASAFIPRHSRKKGKVQRSAFE